MAQHVVVLFNIDDVVRKIDLRQIERHCVIGRRVRKQPWNVLGLADRCNSGDVV
jgi:hypothetical protein